jgi:putative DNA primase/helicase
MNVNHEATASTEPILTPPAPQRTISPHHLRQLVEGSGLTEATARAAGIYSENNQVRQRMMLNWNGPSKNKFTSDALVFPVLRADGTSEYSRLKFDQPRHRKKKDSDELEAVKYESPKGSILEPYFPPGTGQFAKDTRQEIVFTEGEKKALKLTQEGFPAICLIGVWGFRPKGQTCLLPDLDSWDWNGRHVFIAFDSDIERKPEVLKAETKLAALLVARGAVVRCVRFPDGTDSQGQPVKCGADDYMVAAGADCKRRFRELLDNAIEPTAAKGDDERPNAKALDPQEEAAKIVRNMTEDDVCRLRFHMDDWHVHGSGRYAVVLPSEIRAEVVGYLNQRCHHLTSSVVGNVLDNLKAQTILPFGYSPPCWLKPIDGCDWKPHEVISCRNGLLHLPTIAEGGPGLIASTPRFFTPAALDFDYQPDAPPPARWLAFLGSLWGDDAESIAALQEWFGYFLTTDTRQQKMLWLIGPKRSGKSTIARIAGSLVGEVNVCSPTFGSLATNFGLQPLVGKTLGIFADARLSGRTDQAAVTEKLLSITGEDRQTIDRKHQAQVSMKLLVRFLVITNELPRLSDSSGALSGRMIILRTQHSFYGSEHVTLTDELLQERPSILKWAIEGWKRLQQRGRFIQPASGAELRQQMDDISSPIAVFVRERCELGGGFEEPKRSLYQAYQAWSLSNGSKPAADQHFGRELSAAFPAIRSYRPRHEGERLNCYGGIRLRAEFV